MVVSVFKQTLTHLKKQWKWTAAVSGMDILFFIALIFQLVIVQSIVPSLFTIQPEQINQQIFILLLLVTIGYYVVILLLYSLAKLCALSFTQLALKKKETFTFKGYWSFFRLNLLLTTISVILGYALLAIVTAAREAYAVIIFIIAFVVYIYAVYTIVLSAHLQFVQKKMSAWQTVKAAVKLFPTVASYKLFTFLTIIIILGWSLILLERFNTVIGLLLQSIAPAISPGFAATILVLLYITLYAITVFNRIYLAQLLLKK